MVTSEPPAGRQSDQGETCCGRSATEFADLGLAVQKGHTEWPFWCLCPVAFDELPGRLGSCKPLVCLLFGQTLFALAGWHLRHILHTLATGLLETMIERSHYFIR